MTENRDKEILLKGTLQFKDYQTYYMRYSRKRVMAATIASSVLGFVISLYNSFYAFYGAMGYGLILGAMTGVLVFMIEYHRSKRNYNSDSLMQMEQNIIINQQGIQLMTERTNSKFLWGDIVKALEYKGLLLFYISNVKAIVIPTRFFQSTDSVQDFKSIVSKYLKIESKLR